jgi:hypothetical protein
MITPYCLSQGRLLEDSGLLGRNAVFFGEGFQYSEGSHITEWHGVSPHRNEDLNHSSAIA